VEEPEFTACNVSNGKEGRCKPAVLCVGLSDTEEEENACQLERNGGVDDDGEPSFGVCCSDLLENAGQAKFPSADEQETDPSEEVQQEVSGVSVDLVDDVIGER